MSRGARTNKPIPSDLLADGWLPPRSAAAELGITEFQLVKRAERGEIRRKALSPGIYLYEVR